MKSFMFPLVLLCLLVPAVSLGDPWSYPDTTLFVPGDTDILNPVDTGITVPGGSILRILANGVVSWGSDDPSPFGITSPSGSISDISGPVIGAPFNCLVGRIGENGTWFAVGEMYGRVQSAEGRLYLAINDSYYPDNLGSYCASIWLNLDPSSAAPEPNASLRVGLKGAPNPFSRTTGIYYTIPARGDVTLRVFDVEGALVRTLVNGTVDPGDYRVTWDGCDDRGSTVPSGTYFYRIECGGQVTAQKTLRLR